ncbi:hypothetical protein CYMTET_54805 [Cymbomonas tetramitiformis]|uniref:Uncharacterized protein n=1 Tax=Cymbomonas tetramitiformis TaxID=36881 RepID=A0AAE0END5_9CHLO|nr:hypothetical protein CYMTET_54805 [Cymbomonas tetramitiformis]
MAEVLNGCWKCVAAENMEELLKAQGVSWTARTAASAFGYGVGKAKQTLTIAGKSVTIKMEGQSTIEGSFEADGSTVDLFTPDGSTKKGTATIEGDKLILNIEGTVITREVADGKLKMTIVFKDVTAIRMHEKQHEHESQT